MRVDEIKKAVDEGLLVHWGNPAYVVKKDRNNEYYILCIINDNMIGLTWRDKITLNGKEDEFFIGETV